MITLLEKLVRHSPENISRIGIDSDYYICSESQVKLKYNCEYAFLLYGIDESKFRQKLFALPRRAEHQSSELSL